MRSRRWAGLALALVVLVAGIAAWRLRRGQARAPLAAEYAGCAAVLPGPACVPKPERQLGLFVPGGACASPVVAGARLLAPPEDVQGGQRLRLSLAPDAARLTIDCGGGRFDLLLAHEPVPAWFAEARAALRSGQADAAVERVRQAVSAGPAAEQGRALSTLARLELRRGQAERAADLLRRALRDHRQRGRTLELIDDTTVLVFTLLFQERRFDEARALLAALPDARETAAEGAYYIDYYAGLLALGTGDMRSALRALGEAGRRAERTGLERERRAAELVLAEPLQLLGRRDEAETLLARLEREAPPDLPACERAQLRNALGWNRLLARELGERGPDPLPALAQAREALQGGCAHLPDEPLNVALNLALAHLQAGDTRAARAALDAAPASAAPPLHLVLWRREIEARLELAEGRAREALARYDALGRLADATLAWGGRWRASLGRARALRASGRPSEALLAYAEAEQRLDDDTLQVPLQEGRESFVAAHERGTREHLELLLEQGRTEDAFALARRARLRILAALQRGARLARLPAEERRAWDGALSEYRARRDALASASAEDWRLPADRLRRLAAERADTRRQLDALLDRAFVLLDRDDAHPGGHAARTPRPGELLLAFHALPQGEVGFAADAQGVSAARLDCLARRPTPAEQGACLLGPFAARVRAARQVTLIISGAFVEVDFHALPFDGAPLIAGRDVVWSLDLPPQPAISGPAAPEALLVGDPRGDLQAARREAAQVEQALRGASRPWNVTRLEGDAAGEAEVRRRLADVDLFHFAGHGLFAGRGGWESTLPLAGSGALAVGDILALERAPRFALLSGCETGRASTEAAEALGLAHAFLSRGSRAVVAATRRVGDEPAAALVQRFYRSWVAGAPPAEALRQAQLALHQADGHADWAAFRVLEP
jgi:tetratricopeptide (TPR) repeat protein